MRRFLLFVALSVAVSGCQELLKPDDVTFTSTVALALAAADTGRVVLADGNDRIHLVAEVDPRVREKKIKFTTSVGTFMEAPEKNEIELTPNESGLASVTVLIGRTVDTLVATAAIDGFVDIERVPVQRADPDLVQVAVEPANPLLPWSPSSVTVTAILSREIGFVSDSTPVMFTAYAVENGVLTEVSGWQQGPVGYSTSEQKTTRTIHFVNGDPPAGGSVRLVASSGVDERTDSADIPVAAMPVLDLNPDMSAALDADGVSLRVIEMRLGVHGASLPVTFAVLNGGATVLDGGAKTTADITADGEGRATAVIQAGREVGPVYVSATGRGVMITDSISVVRALGDGILVQVDKMSLSAAVGGVVTVDAKVIRDLGRVSTNTPVRFFAEHDDGSGTQVSVGAFSGFGLGGTAAQTDVASSTLTIPANALTAGRDLTVRVATDGTDGTEKTASVTISVES